MNILLTNDDGIRAKGICVLREALAGEHSVTTVAPDGERSAISHAITLDMPLMVTCIEEDKAGKAYSVNGTPADCVKLGIHELLGCKPDMVISGINPGPNVGINLHYSGTVAGAKEAAILGYPAIAVSINSRDGGFLHTAARFVCDLIKLFSKEMPFKGTFLNVNIPNVEVIFGVRITRQGVSGLSELFFRRTDPRKRTYFWQGGETQFFDEDDDTDGAAISQDLVSITPIQCDMTDYARIELLKRWEASWQKTSL
ncbi:MAG: 5'/3'-nucleotidase SurE [Pseudomonadota bacterium]